MKDIELINNYLTIGVEIAEKQRKYHELGRNIDQLHKEKEKFAIKIQGLVSNVLPRRVFRIDESRVAIVDINSNELIIHKLE